MPRLTIFYDVKGWAFHKRAEALKRYAPDTYEVTLSDWRDEEEEPGLGDVAPDIVFCLPAGRMGRLRTSFERRGWNTAIVGAWNKGWPLGISRFHQAYELSDLLVINNHDAWLRMGRLPGTVVIPNGVDEAVFNLKKPIDDRSTRVLWTGSIFHGAVKGYHSHVVPLMKRLNKAGISTDTLRVDSHSDELRSSEEMAEWYNEGTVLVCASELEGTPNPCLEAAACGCTLVSTPVGNMPELIRDGVNGYLVERSVDALYQGVQKAVSNFLPLATQMQEDIRGWQYGTRAADFYKAFDQVLTEQKADRPSASVAVADVDLRDKVTVFVTTVGAPSYAACLQHLEVQDSRFKTEIIEDVAPMSAAFQAMIDRCSTPYYVQVDEDMLLYPHAVRHLYDWIEGAAENVAMCAAPLLDAHLRAMILGVKIFRHDIVRDFPHSGVEAFETEQLQRLAESGFDHLRAPLDASSDFENALGLHGTHWTPQSIFERYARLERKRRRAPSRRSWVAKLPAVFAERYTAAATAFAEMRRTQMPQSSLLRMQRRTELELYALLGCLAGATQDVSEQGKLKNYPTHAGEPGFEAARHMVQGWQGNSGVVPADGEGTEA